MKLKKRFIIAISTICSWLAFTPAAHGGIHLRVCGQIKLEPSYKPDQKNSHFALYTDSFRFELTGQFLSANALREVKKLYAQVGSSGRVLFGCAQSAFAGAFSWSGFAGKEIKLSELSLVPDEEIESMYSFERKD